MRAHNGILTAADFADYRIEEAAPLSCAYRGYTFLSQPPPSSGGVTLCEMLNILEGYDLRGFGFHSAMSVHLMVEAMRRAYFDRNANLGDPDFVHNPLDHLLSKDYAAELRATIAPDEATPEAAIAPGAREKAETTHYSVIDRWGDAASVTYTINGPFGAGIMAPGAGFFLNDEMDDFTTRPTSGNLYGLVQGEANAIAPGKRPLSSMAPTLVMKDGGVVYALGSPGGSRIITAVLETAVNLIDYGLSPQAAVDAPRFHYQGAPDALFAEPLALSPDTAGLTSPRWATTEIVAQLALGRGRVDQLRLPRRRRPPRQDHSFPMSQSAATCGPVSSMGPMTIVAPPGWRPATERRFRCSQPHFLPSSPRCFPDRSALALQATRWRVGSGHAKRATFAPMVLGAIAPSTTRRPAAAPAW